MSVLGLIVVLLLVLFPIPLQWKGLLEEYREWRRR